MEERRRRVTDPNKVLDTFFGDAATPIEWASDAEKQLHFWYDDLHCPNPISPMWFDVGGWWLTCEYMFRRFGVPFGKDWVAKTINQYVMSAVVPRDPKEGHELAPYYDMVMPVYADKFLGWWKTRYLPEILRNFEYLDGFPMDTASMPELMILIEDALDIQERHFRLHWILNFAQFQTSITFQQLFNEMIGEQHAALTGNILTSDEDRNWDSVRDLWKLKEHIGGNPALRQAFDDNHAADGVRRVLAASDAGREVLQRIDAYKTEYGNKSMYTHEYTSTTWREDPTPIVEALRGYLATDYDYQKDVRQMRENREAAIAEMWRLFPPGRPNTDREKLQAALDVALKMTPLTPDHHFYMDQGTYARVRLVFMAIGRTLVARGDLRSADDVLFLRYHELRVLSANPSAFDAKALVEGRRQKSAAAAKTPPRLWAGTITHWSLHEEPYIGLWGWPDVYNRSHDSDKQPSALIKGLGASAGVVEGTVRIVRSPEQFDQVQKGEILVCKMTNPAWVVLFTKIGGLVTDAGGALSHPAVVSREFGLPAVVGTRVATERLKTGQRVRVDGAAGLVEILS
jgi:phosphohistidine swiveling domain-containing protein